MRTDLPGVSFSDNYRTVTEQRILKMLLLAGWAYEQDSPDAAETTSKALDRWIEMGLGAREGGAGERLFDPVEVVNTIKRLGVEGRDSFWRERYVGTGRRLVSDLAGLPEKTFVISYQRTFNLRSIPVGKPLRLRAPLPLKRAHGDRMTVTPFVEGSTAASLDVSNGRLETRLIASGETTLTLGAHLSLPSNPCRYEEADDPTPYLKPREGLIVVSKKVNDLAQALAPPGSRPSEAVQAFWDYFLDVLVCGAMHYDQINPDSPCDLVLQTGWYDCQLGSALFIALCRARGIPARLVSGHVLYHQAPTNHYWVEVRLAESGWTPFDFLSWDLSLGGQDPKWRNTFFGRLDKRMVTQILPFEFTGSIGIAVPSTWHIIQTGTGDAVEIDLETVGGERLYSDFVSIAA